MQRYVFGITGTHCGFVFSCRRWQVSRSVLRNFVRDPTADGSCLPISKVFMTWHVCSVDPEFDDLLDTAGPIRN